MLRNCYKCKERKDEKEFYYQKSHNRYQSRCKLCNNKRAVNRINNLPVEERRAMWRKQQEKTQKKYPEKVEARKLVNLALPSMFRKSSTSTP